MLKFVFALLALAVVSQAAHLSKRASVSDEGTHLLICNQEPIELGIVLDSSSSIPQDDFMTGIKFLQDFLQQFEIGSGHDDVRVSIITFGKGIYPEDSFNLDSYNSKQEVIDAIGNVPHRAGLYTSTGLGIKYMHQNQLTPQVVRPWAEKIGLVITDGNSQEGQLTKQAAEAARASGITMFAIGVGRGIKDQELLNIAGDMSRVTKVDNYDKLESIKETLAHKTCIRKEKPTTTPPPKTQTCGELHPSDINFVFSPATLGRDATGWTTSFISNVVNTEDMDIGFQYGVISGDCPDDAGFDLDEYSNPEDIRERLSYYDRNRIGKLIQTLANEGFSAERGGRPDSRKVAVIVHSHDKKGKGKGFDLSREVSRLTEEGVQVFIADPSGNGIEVEGARTLFGRSSRQASESLISLLCPE